MRKTLKIASNSSSFVKCNSGMSPKLISQYDMTCAENSAQKKQPFSLAHSATMSSLEVYQQAEVEYTTSGEVSPTAQIADNPESKQFKVQLFKYEREIQDLMLRLSEYQRLNTELISENRKLKHQLADAPSRTQFEEQQNDLQRLLRENFEQAVKLDGLQANEKREQRETKVTHDEAFYNQQREKTAIPAGANTQKYQSTAEIEEKDRKIRQLQLELDALRDMFGLQHLKADASFKERAACVLSFKGVKDEYVETLEEENKRLTEKLLIAQKEQTYTEVKQLQMQLYDANEVIEGLKRELENAKCQFEELLSMEKLPRIEHLTVNDY